MGNPELSPQTSNESSPVVLKSSYEAVIVGRPARTSTHWAGKLALEEYISGDSDSEPKDQAPQNDVTAPQDVVSSPFISSMGKQHTQKAGLQNAFERPEHSLEGTFIGGRRDDKAVLTTPGLKDYRRSAKQASQDSETAEHNMEITHLIQTYGPQIGDKRAVSEYIAKNNKAMMWRQKSRMRSSMNKVRYFHALPHTGPFKRTRAYIKSRFGTIDALDSNDTKRRSLLITHGLEDHDDQLSHRKRMGDTLYRMNEKGLELDKKIGATAIRAIQVAEIKAKSLGKKSRK